MSTPASEVYVVAGEPRRGNSLRWVATFALGLLHIEDDAPSVTETVIRRVDGSLVKRLKPGSVAHFEVPDEEARALHAALAARLSGYLVPKLVREIQGDTGKRPL